MSRRTLISLVALSFVVAAGCGAKAKRRPPPGKAATFDTVCAEPAGTAVQLTGYFRYTRSMSGFFCVGSDTKSCQMSLYETGGEPPSNDISDVLRPEPLPEIRNIMVDVPVGGRPGEMSALPKKFSADQVHLHLGGGGVADEGGKVTVDAVVKGSEDATPNGARLGCWLDVTWASS